MRSNVGCTLYVHTLIMASFLTKHRTNPRWINPRYYCVCIDESRYSWENGTINGSWARVSHEIQKYLMRYSISHPWNAETRSLYENMHSLLACRGSLRSKQLAQRFWDKRQRNHSCTERCLYLMRYKSISWDTKFGICEMLKLAAFTKTCTPSELRESLQGP